MRAKATSSRGSFWLKRVVLILGALFVLAGLVYLAKSLMSGGTMHKKAITTVKLLPDTPPPPPPPPPPKEPPKEVKEVKEVKEIQQPRQEPTPPAEVLKMEGSAGDGPSPFAAGAVNSEYKGGDVGTKIGGGPSKYQFAYYTGMIKSHIEQALSKDKSLSSGAYKVVVMVWVASNGRIQRIEIVGSSGDPLIDALIKKAVDEMPAMAETPPSDMPQPVKLRITARSVG